MYQFSQILQSYKYDLFSKANVIGVGIGYKFHKYRNTRALSIVNLVSQKKPLEFLNSKDLIPTTLGGVSTDVWEVGPINAFITRKGYQRPAQPGSSIGHLNSPGSGTFGAVLKGSTDGKRFILSNNHILANLTNGQDNRSKISDPILQPGRLDGGTRSDRIGLLKTYVPLNYGNGQEKPQFVDAALGEPDRPELITNNIIGIGKPIGLGEPSLGQWVLKSGMASGLTSGEVIALRVMLSINYGEQLNVNVVFDDQILATTGAVPGDSGSLLLSSDKKALGMLVGGGGGIDVYNRLSNVLKELERRF